MTKKEIAKILIKKNLLKNINKLYNLYYSNKISGYSWDCLCCGKYDMRCDVEGYVDMGDKILNINDKDF
jgi:hypothetical protein|tara:strand:- start:17 stop:223 length:207 start_codon:yes stop_codon:yes gene_type:complete